MNKIAKDTLFKASALFLAAATAGCHLQSTAWPGSGEPWIDCNKPVEGEYQATCKQLKEAGCELMAQITGEHTSENCTLPTYIVPSQEEEAYASSNPARVFVTTAWLKRDQALAHKEALHSMDLTRVALFHEMGHLVLDHVKTEDPILSHKQEHEADLFGMYGLACVGEDPQMAIRNQALHEEQLYFDDHKAAHPKGIDRIAALTALLPFAQAVQEGKQACPLVQQSHGFQAHVLGSHFSKAEKKAFSSSLNL